MRSIRFSVFVLAAIALPNIAVAQDYVAITGTSVNIRAAPNGTVVAQARSGDIFESKGHEGDWFKVLMFSGEYRYVHTSVVQIAAQAPGLPDEATRRRAFQALVHAEDLATAEADQQISPNTLANIKRNIDLQRILDDRYKLEACHRFEAIQPVHYQALVIEGLQRGWLP